MILETNEKEIEYIKEYKEVNSKLMPVYSRAIYGHKIIVTKISDKGYEAVISISEIPTWKTIKNKHGLNINLPNTTTSFSNTRFILDSQSLGNESHVLKNRINKSSNRIFLSAATTKDKIKNTMKTIQYSLSLVQ